jgi:hypothetical protein
MTLRVPIAVPSPVDNAADPAALDRIEQWRRGGEDTA